MVKVTDKNRRDLETAKRFFEGYTFQDIKVSVECGCFKNAKILDVSTEDFMCIKFESIQVCFKNPSDATICPCVVVYDENEKEGLWNTEEAEQEQKEINLDSVREWLKADEENNVHNILLHIKNNFPKGWDDFIAEEINKAVENLTPPELPDSLYDEIIKDWKGENEDRIISDWLQDESYRDIAEKICFELDGKEVMRALIDEL